MRLTGKQTKRAISLLLCLAVLVSVLTFALTVRAEELPVAGTDASAYDGSSNLTRSKDLADTGANLGYVYCKNTAGWSTVNAYMWIKDTQTNNATWPGKAMTKVSVAGSIETILPTSPLRSAQIPISLNFSSPLVLLHSTAL